jgi:hypothetical protein
MFVRFVVPSRIHAESQVAMGAIALAYQLVDEEAIADADRGELARWLRWFEDHLPVPDRFNRTTSKGWYRRNTRGIAWLRATANEHIEAMRALGVVVTRCGFPVAELRADRVGYVTYEDATQVIAEPFRDTPTR